MNLVKLYVWETGPTGTVEKVVETFVGAIRSDVSPAGVICIQEYTGRQTVMSLDSYSRMESMPMTDEDILSTEGLGAWYQQQIDSAEQRQVENVDESVEH